MTDPVTRLNAALEGRYKIERELGEGGMATVYLAEDLRHERKVALKVLKPELAAVVGAERFLAEIKTTANLQHPHILPLFDSGQADGFLFFVMPYIEGDTLRDKIDREKQLSVEDALKITEKVASALDYAHENGVVHRDIKPGNILLSAKGEPTVADFGIALAVAHAGGGRVTETGLSVGTPHYMSPEQATGDRDVDPRTDVYALGSVLYEMLVGEPPYSGTTAQAVLAKILTDPAPAPTRVRLSIPPNVDAAIRKSLEKLPADRFASAQDFSRALGDPGFRHGEEAGEGVAAAAGLWNPLSIVATVLAVVSTVGFGWLLLRREPPEPVTRQVLSTPLWADVDSPIGRHAAIAPDGSSMILPAASSEGDVQLTLKQRGSSESTPIPGTALGRNPVYSPDGQWIAYLVGADLFKRPLVGGSSVSLAEDADSGGNSGLVWLDDGTILYEQETSEVSTALVRISEDGGEPLETVFQPQANILWASGLPEARGALVVVEPAGVYLVDLSDGSSELILNEVLRAWHTPTGHIVYVRTDGAVFAALFDLGSLELADSGVPVFDGVRMGVGSADILVGVDGRVLYVDGGGASFDVQQLLVVDLEGNEEALPLSPRTTGGASWSPDEELVAYWDGDLNLYTHNIVLGTTPRQLTFEGENAFPVFSPDGSRVAFTSQRDGTEGFDLFVKTLNDDAPATALITLPGSQVPSHWVADTLIVFESFGEGPDILTLNLSDPDNPRAEEYLSSEGFLMRMRISPDGNLAAYHATVATRSQIYIRSFPIPREQTLVSEEEGLFPFWAADGNTLYYWRNEGSSVGTFMAARIQRDPTAVLSRDSLFTGPYLQRGSAMGAYPAPSLSDFHPDSERLIVGVGAGGEEPDEFEPNRLILVQNFFEELRQVVPD